MQQTYDVVPDILTGKDVDYLTDIFNWNYGALKKFNHFLNLATNDEIKDRLNEAISMFDDNMNEVLNILKEESCE